jgi:predicted nuclease of predicted toxin-antitoxin system
MKLLFDQNISHRILSLLPEEFSNSTSVKKEKLNNLSDQKIWEFAKTNGFIIVTQDSDFNDLTLLHGFPPKIIWIRTGNINTKELGIIITHHLQLIQKFNIDDQYGCFEIFRLTS